jgi:hypothetical protein
MKPEKRLQIRNSTAEFLIFTRQAGEDGIEDRVAEETVWLTQKLIGVLFEKGRSTITEHLKNLFDAGELAESAVCRDFRHIAGDGKDYTTRFYNLDAFIAVIGVVAVYDHRCSGVLISGGHRPPLQLAI